MHLYFCFLRVITLVAINKMSITLFYVRSIGFSLDLLGALF